MKRMTKKQTQIVVMEDKGPWRFTEDQIYKIKMFNKLAIRKFYEDNYNLICAMACKFVSQRVNIKRDYSFNVDDLKNQVYIDLPYYDFSSRGRLYFCIIKGSFLKVNFGGYNTPYAKYLSSCLTISYDKPISDTQKNTSYVLDLMKSQSDFTENLIDEASREEKDQKICEFLERTIKNKKDLNKMFCQIFTDIPLNEIKGDEYEFFKQRKNQIG